MPNINPFNSPFGAGKPEGLPLSALAGRGVLLGPGKKSRSKKKGGFTAIDPTWLAGVGSPLIDGATVQLVQNANANVYSNAAYEPSVNTSTSKLYMEIRLDSFDPSIDGASFSFGLKQSTYKASYITGYMFGMEYVVGAAAIRVWLNINSGSGSNTITNLSSSDFASGSIIGVAVDFVNNKLYFHANGTWASSGGGSGGEPGVGDGYNTVEAAFDAHLFLGTSSHGIAVYDTFTYGNSGLYLPDGYTFLT